VSLALASCRTALTPPWVRNDLWRRAQAVPSLDLRFAGNKSLVDAVTGQSLVTFTRASTGMFTNSAGVIQTAATDVPRFDHNPTTGESLGLLVEEARTNLRLNSATYQPTSGGTPAAYTVDQVAPDGTLTGSRQTAATPRTFEDYTGIANALYTFSFYCRVTSGTASFSIQLKNAATDTVITSDTSPVATTTWKRFSISGTTNGATPGARVEIVGVVPGFVFWGAQLEAGAFPTSYIPTTTAAATRSADVVSITGSAFSSWYRQDEGTVFAEFGPYGNGGAAKNAGIVQLDSGSAVNRIGLFGGSMISPVFIVDTSSVNQAYIFASTISPSATSRITGAYKINDFARAVNGSNLGTDSSGTVPTLNQMLIGIGSAGVSELCGTIRRLTYWPQRLANSTLQSITQ
jgi:hypothetical protein